MTFITYSSINNNMEQKEQFHSRKLELLNRLKKNEKKRASLVNQLHIEAYRLYDRDIPAFPYIIDRYGDIFIIYEKGKKDVDLELQQQNQQGIVECLIELFACSADNIIFKQREIKSGVQQYEKRYAGYRPSDDRIIIREGEAQFYIHPTAYLDCGLFLDHRPMRFKLKKIGQGKTLLNLFSYTSSVSVQAALGGAITTSVDKSKRYIAWSQENFKLNKLDVKQHEFVVADTFSYLRELASEANRKFDLIFIDPPTFSNEKKKDLLFEVEKDHRGLIRLAMQLLAPKGILFFSTNKRTFKIDTSLAEEFVMIDISKKSIPFDFDDKKIHYCFQFQHKENL